MKKLLDPRWIFFINTLPIIILLFIGWSEFHIIESFLSEENLYLWRTFALSLVGLSVLSLGYAIERSFRKRTISILYSLISLIIYTAYLYVYFLHSEDLVSWNVPRWLFSGNIFLYVGTFLMPTLIHSLLCLVIIFTPETNGLKAWHNILTAIAIPILFYVFGILIIPMSNGGAFDTKHLFFILIIIATLCFLFFLVRFIYILISDKRIKEEYELMWKLPIALCFPILGLGLNTVLFDNLFGDFSGYVFPLIALVNGVIICLPSFENRLLRLSVFFLRCSTFTYTLYFFLVFLPFLPLSVFAILIIGVGFLMLTPLMLFVIHLDEIYEDLKYLKTVYSKSLLYTIMVGGLLVLPIGVSLSYKYDKTILFETLDYLYSPDYSKEYNLNATSVLKTVKTIDENKTQDLFYSSTPYLSAYFKWLALDNLNLSYNKKQLIRNVFSDAKVAEQNKDLSVVGNPEISISDIQYQSQYNKENSTWTSWIDLSIKNENASLWNSEYITQIDLPDGCWISDYYLYVGDEKEMGILAEKKAATWVFTQIRNENRDPGMLRYISGNRVDFRVFPFEKGETRYTGIEFIHKDPVVINIDGHSIVLGRENKIEKNPTLENKVIAQIENEKKEVIYISSLEKENLPVISRKPYYHFIVDISNQDNQERKKYAKDIKTLLESNLISQEDAQISYTGTYVNTMLMNDNWEEDLMTEYSEGGFFLDRAIKKVLFNSYTNPQDSYPIIVVVSNDIKNAILYNNFADLKFTYPENSKYYCLSEGKLISYSLFESSRSMIEADIKMFPESKVKAYPSAVNPITYLCNDNLPSVALNTRKKTLEVNLSSIKEKDWESGLLMQGQWMLQVLYPQTADDEWLALIQNSFKSKILTPLTSYIVVENEAQKIMLKNKQDEALSGNRSLDLNDDTQRMSEPGIFVMLLLLGLLYMFNKRRIRKV